MRLEPKPAPRPPEAFWGSVSASLNSKYYTVKTRARAYNLVLEGFMRGGSSRGGKAIPPSFVED